MAKDDGDRIVIGVSQAEIDLSRELGFDAISRPTTIREVLKEVNPNYKGDPATDLYSVNCQRAVYAYEARLRGLNVVAKPALNLDISKDKVAQKYLAVMQGQQYKLFPSSESIYQHILSMPDGARAVITVDWDDKQYGHAFIAQKINGKTVLIDPQTGSDASNYLEKAKQNGKFVFSRIDNLRFDAKLLAEVCAARTYENG